MHLQTKEKQWEDFKKTWTKIGCIGTLSANNEKNAEITRHESWDGSCILDSGASNTVVLSNVRFMKIIVMLISEKSEYQHEKDSF
jgi:hypothetical protein